MVEAQTPGMYSLLVVFLLVVFLLVVLLHLELLAVGIANC